MPPRKNQSTQHSAHYVDNRDPMASGITDDALAADDSGLGGLEQFLFANTKWNSKDTSSDHTNPLPVKVAAPTDTDQEREAILSLQSAYSRMISVPPKKCRKSCFGYFHSDLHLVAIPDKPIDTISRTSGFSKDAVIYLMPEEWLLFVERGSLLIADKDIGTEKPLVASYDSIWSAALNTARLNLDIYRAYAYLRRLGYIVVCPDNIKAAYPEDKGSGFLDDTPSATNID
ncbi:hypothetical protein GGI15_004220 [Coemansia interrupta]|uniref:tRNA-splicing endonuclease subunit Sen54 N-terminal domain-containing protein n=1 Tax=Coemansia interrupta TaxID=1126814 RepID=A0A9W8H5F8_9FUNG|nr:hypothetical protein GGI15_004220 [Coemansia interrupta]